MKRLITMMLLLTMIVGGANAKKDKEPVKGNKTETIYAYGLSTCFNDTIAYLTDVIQLDGVEMEKEFLLGRQEYSQQLKQHFEAKGLKNRLCTFFFSKKREKAEKAYVKLRKRLVVKDGCEVRQLTSDEFVFKVVKVSE